MVFRLVVKKLMFRFVRVRVLVLLVPLRLKRPEPKKWVQGLLFWVFLLVRPLLLEVTGAPLKTKSVIKKENKNSTHKLTKVCRII